MRTHIIRQVATLLASVIFAVSSNAQINTLIFGASNKSGDYWGQRAENGEKAGIGIVKLDNDKLYVGDFNRGKPEGKGMIICESDNGISNCKGSYIYYGSWIKGKKEGKGKCYDQNGHIIYEDPFSNDKPLEKYPMNSSLDSESFGRYESQDGTIILSQIKDSYPNGFGIGCLSNGAHWIGKFKNGQCIGTGLMITSENDWVVVKINKDEITEITSSKEYYAHKASHDSSWKQLQQATKELLVNNVSKVLTSQSTLQQTPLYSKSDNTNNVTSINPDKYVSDTSIDTNQESEKYNQVKHPINKDDLNKNKEKEKQAKYASLHRKESQRALDAVMDEILDRKNNPEKYSYESTSQFTSKIKRLQKEAKDMIRKFQENSGGQKLAYVESLLNWKP